MSTLTWSIVESENQKEDTRETAFCQYFSDNRGLVFGVFQFIGADLTHMIRERMTRWASRVTPASDSLEAAFEHLVQAVNEDLGNSLTDETISFQAVIGAIGTRTLVLTGIGEFRATLLREEKPGTFHVYDLMRGLREENISNKKTFGALVSGELSRNDTLGLALPETIEIVGEGNWKNLLATAEPAEMRAKLSSLFREKKNSGIALMMRINDVTEPSINSSPSKPISTEALTSASIEALRKTEKATENILKGSYDLGRGIFKKIKPLLVSIISGLVELFKKRPKLSSIKHLAKRPTNFGRNLRARNLRDIYQGFGRLRDYLINRFNSMNKVSKMLVIGLVVFVVLFVQSIIYLGYRSKMAASREAYNKQVAEISRSRDEAEAMVIYRDEVSARALLLSARDKINALPQDSRAHRRTADDLRKKIEDDLVGLRHEISVTPATLALLPADAPANSYTSALYESVNPLLALAANLPSPPVDVVKFNNRLYALSPSAPQIYRLNKTGDTYGSFTVWTRDNQDKLSDARSLAVDGAVYVLKPAEIIKFFTGSLELWTPYIDPPLTNATRVWTTDEANGIYILEPATRRVIVLDKPGGLLAQYIFPDGADLKNLAVDEKNKKLSVLNGDRIEEIELTHIVGK